MMEGWLDRRRQRRYEMQRELAEAQARLFLLGQGIDPDTPGPRGPSGPVGPAGPDGPIGLDGPAGVSV